jgi:hypothetical protein
MKVAIATVAVFVVWEILDFIIHRLMLGGAYESTAALWRPEAQMKMPLMFGVVLVASFAFVMIYDRLIRKRGMVSGLSYGLWFGLAMGISMGYGTYAVMPIPYSMAATWFWGTVVQGALGGVIVAAIIKEPAAPSPAA